MTMTSPTTATAPDAGELTSAASDLDLPNGDDLALSRGTDFYGLDELLTGPERELRDRVRVWCDTEVSPAAAEYWERAEFPVRLVKGYAGVCRPRHRRRLDRRRRVPWLVVPCRGNDRRRTGPR